MSTAELFAQGCLTVAQAVEFSTLSRSLLYQEMDAGRLPYVRREGRDRRMIPKAGLVEYLNAGLIGGPERTAEAVALVAAGA